MTDERLLRARDVQAMVGLGESGLYKMVAEGRFPAPVRISGNMSRWLHSEVVQWIAEQVTRCRTPQTPARIRRSA